MSVLSKSSKIIASVSLIALVSLSQLATAQISKYDSMYFPTTQSLEGTRSAPMFYDLLNISFDAKGASKPQYFADLKKAYAKPINAELTLGADFEIAVSQIDFSSTDSVSDLQALHTNTLKRLNIQSLDTQTVASNPILANNPDLFAPLEIASQFE
jgi:hypothetical protein